LGAEKALFKAMRTKHATPKYGLIYYASVIGQTPPKLKGKISRSVAAKCSLCIRYDALGESVDGKFGNMNRQYIENKIKQLNSGVDISNNKYKYKMPKWEPKTDVKSFNVEEDFPETVKEKEEAKPAKPAKKRKASKEKAEKTKKYTLCIGILNICI
jgi:nucleolar protein 58